MKLPFTKKSAQGVAILTVMVSLALMMAIVTELSTKEIVRYKLAVNERDALQAEALAQSGANFAQIILTVQEPLQTYFTSFAKMGVQLPTYLVWDLMPIDSDLLKGITDGSFFPEFDLSGSSDNKVASNLGKDSLESEAAPLTDEAKKKKAEADKPKDVPLFGPYEIPTGGYGGFYGRFSTEIEDDDRYISIRKWPKMQPAKAKMVGDLIYRVLSKKENQYLFDGSTGDNANIGPSQIVGNIFDYISDLDRAVDVTAPKERWGKDGVGDKRAAYVDSPGIIPKGAPMDSLAELRLVPGMTDALYKVLSKIITIYGESEKINILSATDDILPGIFYLCAKNKESGPILRYGFDEELVTEWNRRKNDTGLDISVDGVVSFLEENGVEADKNECSKSVGTESKTFLVKSTATVGSVTRTVHVRLRSVSGLVTLYLYQYL